MSPFAETLEGRQFFTVTPIATAGQPFDGFRDGGGTVGTVAFRSDTKNDSAGVIKVLTDSGERVYVVAQTSESVQVRRLGAFGAADPTYANDRGLIGLPFAKPKADDGINKVSAAIDAADRLLLLAGNKLYRFTTSGKIDKNFGVNGVVDLSGTLTGTAAVDTDRFNRIYLAGSAVTAKGASTYNFDVARLRSSGKLDAEFGRRGVYAVATLGRTDFSSRGQCLRVLQNDDVVAAAAAQYRRTDNDVQYLDRTATGVQSVLLTADGNGRLLDTDYGNTGHAEHFTGSTDVDYAGEDLVGITGTGDVITQTHSVSADSPDPVSRVANHKIARSNAAYQDYSVDGGSGRVLHSADFAVQPDGSSAFVLDRTSAAAPRLFRSVDGTPDNTFADSGSIAGVQGFALDADHTITAAFSSATRKLSVNVARYFDTPVPVGNLSQAKPVTAKGSAAFAVAYSTPNGFDSNTDTIGDAITVTKPDGTILHPRVTNAYANVPGRGVLAYYRLTNDGQPFTAADNGVYTVNLLPEAFKDHAGVAAEGRTLGTLTIKIA